MKKRVEEIEGSVRSLREGQQAIVNQINDLFSQLKVCIEEVSKRGNDGESSNGRGPRYGPNANYTAKPLKLDFPRELTKLRQQGAIQAYQTQFNKLLAKVGYLPPDRQVSCFRWRVNTLNLPKVVATSIHAPEDKSNFQREEVVTGAIIAISDELVSSITQVVNLFLGGKCPKVLGEYIASAPLTPLVKPVCGIRPITVGTILRRLVSKVCVVKVGHSLDGYLDGLQFGVAVSGGGEAILHAVNRLIEGRGDDVGLSMLLVDFKNAFNLVDREVMLQEVRLRCPSISRWVEFCYSNPARLYYGEHTLLSCQDVQRGDHLGPLLFALVLHPLI
uniref:Reverse transcriptase domain-containing protein n=1 Tax=Tanacetum cinerariifolium TaxID=118510 RepID=A0A6L2LHP9_TANCI|nr:hypothetical protein [Tanacetum cinerariifolium]